MARQRYNPIDRPNPERPTNGTGQTTQATQLDVALRPLRQQAIQDNIQPNESPIIQPAVSPVSGFGTKAQTPLVYPNDVVRLDLYNAVDVYLGTNYRVGDFTLQSPPAQQTQSELENVIRPNQVATLNVESNIQQIGYVAGRYRAIYKFHRNILGSGDGHKLVVQEISANGLEIRVRPAFSTILDNSGFIQYFQEGLFKTPKSQILSSLFLFKDANSFFPVFDYVQDRFTISSSPFSIIFKLSSPAPADVVVGNQIWLAQQISEDFTTTATIQPPDISSTVFEIAAPNFDVLARVRTGLSTNYKGRNQLVSTNNATSIQLQDRLVSSSLVEGININTDFRSFENFSTYSTVERRIENFKHKLTLIEGFDARIASLTTDLIGLPSSSASGSTAFTTNINTNIARKSSVIGSFDSYEKHLYYQSASYESSSFGEFYPSTWPKQNSVIPYINYSVTSSEGDEWYRGSISSASLYDKSNRNNLTKSVPAHIVEDINNETYIKIVEVAGHYFDDIIPYINEYTNRYNRTQQLSEGLSKDLLFLIGQNLGFEFENGVALSDLWSYTLGTDETGSIETQYNTTVEDTMKETWKRIINNLPYLIQTKGTERCLRALINCFGIPDTILRIREYGGHEGSFDKKSDFIYNRHYYSFIAGYNGQTNGLPAQQINAPWTPLTQSGLFPQTIELRVRMADNQTKDQTIFEVPDLWKVRAFVSGGSNHIGFFLSGSQGYATASTPTTLYDTDTEDPYTDQDTRWHHVALRRENQTDTPTDNQTYTLIVKTSKYNKVTTTTTASLFVDGGTSASYNTSYTTAGELWIPGSGSYTLAQSHSMDLFSGSIQELRYWTSELQDAILDNHTLTPTSFQGNTDGIFTGSTSSFDTLAYRLTLGTDSKKVLDTQYPATTSFQSQHPNQAIQLPAAEFYNITSSAYYDVIEENSLEWPDLGANRSLSAKIRIDNTVLLGEQLYTNTKAEKPLTDNNPPDSPRLGIFLSPTSEIDQDIAEQFGGISIDDFIGNPTDRALDNYPELVALQREYSKKYTALNKPNEYIRLLQHYNAALFQLIKSFVPYRANTQTGLIIEPTIIERSRIAIPPPVVEDLTISASLDLRPETLFPPKGEVEDPTNEPLSHYVAEATIGGDLSDYLIIQGDTQEILPQDDNAAIDLTKQLTGDFGAYAETDIAIDLTMNPDGEFYEFIQGDAIDLGVNAAGHNSRYDGTKYIYMTYASIVSGSVYGGSFYGTGSYGGSQIFYQITASRYDDWDAINPTILTSRFSEQSSPDDFKHQKDIWNFQSFENYYTENVFTLFTSSAALQESEWTNNFGLRISSSYAGTTQLPSPLTLEAGWFISGSRGGVDGTLFNGLNFTRLEELAGGLAPYSGSVLINAFFNEREDANTTDYRYHVRGRIKTKGGSSDNSGSVVFQSGKEQSAFSNTFTWEADGSNTTTIPFDFITQADGPNLVITVRQLSETDFTASFVAIQDLVVQPLNYYESVQDYHLWNARGMINARYEGCKLTSTDYNVDSPDTIDNGPVITITEGGGIVLTAIQSTQQGTFAIR